MQELMGQVNRLAAVAQPVVIMGPSGSGKELVAQALHYEGSRADAPFIATNSASMPLTLAEDELFGHEKGAFTGATAQRIGCLEQAHGGTLFLDEIGDMDAQIQAKLLRVLENGTFTRLGGTTPVCVNVRVVAATHKDLNALVQQGSFRHDLWYRLCAFVLRTPPLSQRPEDIALLAQHFLERTCAEMSIVRRFDEQALQTLTNRDYPGNVRELRHAITRAAVYAVTELIDQPTIQAALGSPQSSPQPSTTTFESYGKLDFRAARNQFELDYLNFMLTRHEGSITATAAAIGMAQSNLSRKLKELGLR
jgi:DNA-binding NtrC family response regulator